MLVSVLLPTRNRVVGLAATVESIRSLATDLSRIEILFKVDDDDEATIEAVERYRTDGLGGEIKVIRGPRGGGYADLHNFFNALADAASGRWLFVFNDDAVLSTTGWDDHLSAVHPADDVGIGYPHVVNIYEDGRRLDVPRQFPMVTRKLHNIVGHLSTSPHVDSYLIELGERVGAGVVHEIPSIVVENFPHSVPETRSIDLINNVTSPRFGSAEVQDAIKRDARAVHAALGCS